MHVFCVWVRMSRLFSSRGVKLTDATKPYFLFASCFVHICRHKDSRQSFAGRPPAVRAMRLCTPPPCFVLTAGALLLMLPLFGSCHPAQTSGQPRLLFMEHLSLTKTGFNWKNVTCPLCKAVFTILDIALLVMF